MYLSKQCIFHESDLGILVIALLQRIYCSVGNDLVIYTYVFLIVLYHEKLLLSLWMLHKKGIKTHIPAAQMIENFLCK